MIFMKIPFLDLYELNKSYEEEIRLAVDDVLRSGWFILGKKGEMFEKEFAEFCQSKHCIGLANGLDALVLMLRAFDLPPNSEIIVPANTYIATILAILNAGFRPVLVEPNLATYLLDEDCIEEKITNQTKAILFVELYGNTGSLEKLRHIADKYQLKLLVDAAQSHGVTYRNKPTTHWFDAVAYSFYPTKNLGAMGDAGCVVTNDAAVAQRIKYLRNYGSFEKYKFDYQGINSRLDEFQAVILSVKLPYLSTEIDKRRQIAKRYISEIKNNLIILPTNETASNHAWHLFVVRCEKRDKLKDFLFQNGISTDIHYPIPPHKQKALAQFNSFSFPITEQIHREVISIPLNSTLSENEVTYIIKTLNEFHFD